MSIGELVDLYGQLPGGPYKTGNISPFEDIQSVYWSGTEFTPNPLGAFVFAFSAGNHGVNNKNFPFTFAWAVRQGDILAVPEPSTLLLLGAGLAGFGFGRRRLH